jgi:hypothetical protein
MKRKLQSHDRKPPEVQIVSAENVVDVRRWARDYVNLILTLEGIAPVPAQLPRAS